MTHGAHDRWQERDVPPLAEGIEGLRELADMSRAIGRGPFARAAAALSARRAERYRPHEISDVETRHRAAEAVARFGRLIQAFETCLDASPGRPFDTMNLAAFDGPHLELLIRTLRDEGIRIDALRARAARPVPAGGDLHLEYLEAEFGRADTRSVAKAASDDLHHLYRLMLALQGRMQHAAANR